MMKLLIEAAVIGAALVVVQHVVCMLLKAINVLDEKVECNLLKMDSMTLAVFLSGATLHLVMELVGANKWYCKKGHACQQ